MGERERIDENPSAAAYGRYYWMVELADGGWVSVHANRVDVVAGTVVFYGSSHHASPYGVIDYDAPVGPEHPTIGFGAGQWRTFYAAKNANGDPVAVDRWVEAVPE